MKCCTDEDRRSGVLNLMRYFVVLFKQEKTLNVCLSLGIIFHKKNLENILLTIHTCNIPTKTGGHHLSSLIKSLNRHRWSSSELV